MKPFISETTLAKLSQFIGENLGLCFPKEKWIDLERGLIEITKQYQFKETSDCIEWLTRLPVQSEQLEVLGKYFTVGETYFFRDKNTFSALEETILPKLIEEKSATTKTIRVWSACCSSGEEPYSIAILLKKLIPNLSSWKVTILASDINVEAQHRLQQGIYGEWSFRDTSPNLKNYFTKLDNNRYQILPDIKNLVTALYLNLASDLYPSLQNNTNAMDIILCRNALMYFLPEKAKDVIFKLTQALVEGGYLIVAAPELSLIQDETLKPLHHSGAFIYQKQTSLLGTHSDQRLNNELEISYFSHIESVDSEIIEESFIESHQVSESTDNFQKEPKIEAQQEKAPEIKNELNTIEALSRDLANQGKLKEALQLIDEAIVSQKFNEHYRYLKALILIEIGSMDEAIGEFKRAIYLNPNFILPYFSLGNIAYSQGDHTEIKRNFSAVLSLLKNHRPEEIIPGSEGLTVKRISEIINSVAQINGLQL